MTHLGRHNRLSNTKVGAKEAHRGYLKAACFAAAILFAVPISAQAQDSTQASSAVPSSALLAPTQGPKDFNLKMPTGDTTRMLDLNLDFDSIGCLVGEQNCLRDTAPVDMGFSTSIAKKSDKGLDLELVPTASMRFDDESRSAVVGAVVRIGEDLRSKDVSSNTWYVFAGADAEALSYSPESATALTRGEFGLSDRIIIGDAQAGVGYRIGSADVSLGYFRREISSLNDTLGTEGFSKTEDAAALSFTWKR